MRKRKRRRGVVEDVVYCQLDAVVVIFVIVHDDVAMNRRKLGDAKEKQLKFEKYSLFPSSTVVAHE